MNRLHTSIARLERVAKLSARSKCSKDRLLRQTLATAILHRSPELNHVQEGDCDRAAYLNILILRAHAGHRFEEADRLKTMVPRTPVDRTLPIHERINHLLSSQIGTAWEQALEAGRRRMAGPF